MRIAVFMTFCFTIVNLCCAVIAVGENGSCKQTYQYSKEELLSLRFSVQSDINWTPWSIEGIDIVNDEGSELPKHRYKPKRKRGRRAGVRVQTRRAGHKVPMPTIMCGNVRSIRNKSDELSINCKFNSEFRDSSLICLTETWLQSQDADGTVDLDNFSLIRGDRILGHKQQGGGVCIYVNQRWCKNVTVKQVHCDENVEYLTVACRPFFLPREFNNLYLTVAYVPPSGDYKKVAETLVNCVHFMDENCPNGIKLLLGDFNDCDIKRLIPSYQQCVKCSTREDKMLDLVFCNIKDAYRVIKRPPLGNSDHNMLYCLPTYKQKFKSQSCRKIQVKQWSDENVDLLRSCFECTDWDILYDANASLDENVDTFTCYLNFCIDMLVPSKSVRIFANNKPWLTKDVKEIINRKKSITIK